MPYRVIGASAIQFQMKVHREEGGSTLLDPEAAAIGQVLEDAEHSGYRLISIASSPEGPAYACYVMYKP